MVAVRGWLPWTVFTPTARSNAVVLSEGHPDRTSFTSDYRSRVFMCQLLDTQLSAESLPWTSHAAAGVFPAGHSCLPRAAGGRLSSTNTQDSVPIIGRLHSISPGVHSGIRRGQGVDLDGRERRSRIRGPHPARALPRSPADAAAHEDAYTGEGITTAMPLTGFFAGTSRSYGSGDFPEATRRRRFGPRATPAPSHRSASVRTDRGPRRRRCRRPVPNCPACSR